VSLGPSLLTTPPGEYRIDTPTILIFFPGHARDIEGMSQGASLESTVVGTSNARPNSLRVNDLKVPAAEKMLGR
jgi:hypothetical protein